MHPSAFIRRGVMNRGPGRTRRELSTTLRLFYMLTSKVRRWLVSALKRVRSESFRLRVVPSEGAWKVAFDRDSSNRFWAKADTIKCARELARLHGLSRIAVCDDHERVIAVIRVQPF